MFEDKQQTKEWGGRVSPGQKRKKLQKIPFLTIRLVGELFVLVEPLQFFGRKRTNVLCLVVQIEPLPTIKLIHLFCVSEDCSSEKILWITITLLDELRTHNTSKAPCPLSFIPITWQQISDWSFQVSLVKLLIPPPFPFPFPASSKCEN